MSIFLGNPEYLMGNCVGFSNLLVLCCQCNVGYRVFIATGSQVGAWPSRVHPWRLRRTHPWWWDSEVWDYDFCTWKVHVDIALKTCRTVPIVVFYDIGLFRGNSFGQFWTHFVRYIGVFGRWLLLWRVYSLVQISCSLGEIPESCSISTIWKSPMLENCAWGAGFCRAWANLWAAMMTFSEE